MQQAGHNLPRRQKSKRERIKPLSWIWRDPAEKKLRNEAVVIECLIASLIFCLSSAERETYSYSVFLKSCLRWGTKHKLKWECRYLLKIYCTCRYSMKCSYHPKNNNIKRGQEKTFRGDRYVYSPACGDVAEVHTEPQINKEGTINM